VHLRATLQPTLIAVAGPTCSGKTTLVWLIAERLNSEQCAVLSQDDFYRDLASLSLEERQRLNFDLPGAVDALELIRTIKRLLRGWSTEVPVYDFTKHTRSDKFRTITPRPYLLVEGTLVLHWSAIRSRARLRVYLDVPGEECLRRRLVRDTETRGRSEESVYHQWRKTVWPMHRRYVIPTRRYADLLLDGHNLEQAADRIVETLRSLDNAAQ